MHAVYLFTIIFIKHSIITQAARQGVLCFSDSLSVEFIYLWLISLFVCYSRKIKHDDDESSLMHWSWACSGSSSSAASRGLNNVLCWQWSHRITRTTIIKLFDVRCLSTVVVRHWQTKVLAPWSERWRHSLSSSSSSLVYSHGVDSVSSVCTEYSSVWMDHCKSLQRPLGRQHHHASVHPASSTAPQTDCQSPPKYCALVEWIYWIN